MGARSGPYVPGRLGVFDFGSVGALGPVTGCQLSPGHRSGVLRHRPKGLYLLGPIGPGFDPGERKGAVRGVPGALRWALQAMKWGLRPAPPAQGSWGP